MIITKIKETETMADNIYNEVAENCDFYKDQNGEGYMVSYKEDKYDLKYLSNFNATALFLRQLYFEIFNCVVKSGDIKNAYETVVANASSCSEEVPVYVRVGQCGGTLYYHLLNDANEVVKMSKDGVEIMPLIDVENMFFNSEKDMREQVFQDEGDKYTLLELIDENFMLAENQKLLLAVFICAALIPNIKHPILIVEGEKGAGKSTLLEEVGSIINPVKKDLFAIPNNKDGLITLLSNNYYCPIDNVGKISDEFSDVLCQASTGGNLTKRKLYTDNTEFTVNIKRIVALNGIDLGITQSDLLDRAILIDLKRIDESKRQPMEVIEERFNKHLPFVMANIFEILSKALAIYPTVKLDKYPRMADFCRYGYAIAEAIQEGYGSKFIDEYYNNIEFATEKAIEQSPLLESIRYFVEKHTYWKGSATELLRKLYNCLREIRVGGSVHNLLPETPNALSREINKHSHELKKSGISVRMGRAKERYIEIKKVDSGTTMSTNATIKNEKKSTIVRKSLLED